MNAEEGIAVKLVAGRRMLERDLRKIGIELVSEDHRDRGVDALAHFGLRHHQRGLARMIETNEDVGCELAVGAVRRLLRLIDRARRQMEGKHKSAGETGLEHAAP